MVPETTHKRTGDGGLNGLRCFQYFKGTPMKVFSDKVNVQVSHQDVTAGNLKAEDECASLNRTTCCSSAEQTWYLPQRRLHTYRKIPNIHPCMVAKPGETFEDGSV